MWGSRDIVRVLLVYIHKTIAMDTVVLMGCRAREGKKEDSECPQEVWISGQLIPGLGRPAQFISPGLWYDCGYSSTAGQNPSSRPSMHG